jgi:Zn-dependent protease
LIQSLKRWLLVGPVLLYSIILHEMAHGYVALLNGDPTALDQGRLTLNPLPHIDLWGSILIPLALMLTRAPFLIAWAKPVEVRPELFVTDPRVATLETALAGPATNLVLAVLLMLCLRLSSATLLRSRVGRAVRIAIVYGVLWNTMLTFFNFLPIPPLDGFRLVQFFFPAIDRLKVLNSFQFNIALLAVVLLVARKFLVRPIQRISEAMLNWAEPRVEGPPA